MNSITALLEKIQQEFTFETSRSSGKGGQHVNKTESRVTLVWDFRQSVHLKEEEKELIESDFEMIEKYSLQATDYGSIAGQYMILPLTFKNFSIPRLGKTKQRKYNIHVKRGYSNSSIQTIKIPESYQYIDKLTAAF